MNAFPSVYTFTSMVLFCSSIVRFLARVLLIPFPFQAPSVELGSLNNLLEDTPASFPTLLQIGHKVINVDHDNIYSIRGAIESMLRHGASLIDSRLMTQYAISIAMAQKVLLNSCHIM